MQLQEGPEGLAGTPWFRGPCQKPLSKLHLPVENSAFKCLTPRSLFLPQATSDQKYFQAVPSTRERGLWGGKWTSPCLGSFSTTALQGAPPPGLSYVTPLVEREGVAWLLRAWFCLEGLHPVFTQVLTCEALEMRGKLPFYLGVEKNWT